MHHIQHLAQLWAQNQAPLSLVGVIASLGLLAWLNRVPQEKIVACSQHVWGRGKEGFVCSVCGSELSTKN